MLPPDTLEKWQNIIDSVEKTKIPIEFINKLIIRLEGRRQRTINITAMINQGFDIEDVEDAVSRKLEEYDDKITSVEFVLDIEGIAKIVQPATDELLIKMK